MIWPCSRTARTLRPSPETTTTAARLGRPPRPRRPPRPHRPSLGGGPSGRGCSGGRRRTTQGHHRIPGAGRSRSRSKSKSKEARLTSDSRNTSIPSTRTPTVPVDSATKVSMCSPSAALPPQGGRTRPGARRSPQRNASFKGIKVSFFLANSITLHSGCGSPLRCACRWRAKPLR